ncbi:MAG: SBBP repeat-containing protein [Promethearchaeota archaeon]
MTKNLTKTQIFLLVVIFWCIALSSNPLNFSLNSLKVSIESSGVINAAINSDLEITWGGIDMDSGNDIALDTSGNIYITGHTESFGEGSDDAFIAKFDSTGNSLLNITWGGSDSDSGNAITVDTSGNIYITGHTESFGEGSDDAFIAKYDSTGNSLLNITWGGNDSDSGNDIALDSSGNIYITGTTESFGAGIHDVFIAKYDSAGNSLLNITWGGNDWDYGLGITLDTAGNIYTTGFTESFGAGIADAFVAKYDNVGNSLLNITWGGINNDHGLRITLDASGNIYITGNTYSFGAGTYDVFLAKYDSLGNSLLNITWGGSDWDYGRDIVLDALGNIYITGSTESFGAGTYDVFLVKYDSLGNSLLNITWGGSEWDFGNGIALDASDNVYITGGTENFGMGGRDAFIVKYDMTDTKTDDSTPGISGYNLFFLLSILSVVVFTISKKLKKS